MLQNTFPSLELRIQASQILENFEIQSVHILVNYIVDTYS